MLILADILKLLFLCVFQPIVFVMLVASCGLTKATEDGDLTVSINREDEGETVEQTSKTEAVRPSVVETPGVQVEDYEADSEHSSNVEGGDNSDNDSPDDQAADNTEADGEQWSNVEGDENTANNPSDNRGDRGIGKKLKKPLRVMAKGAWKGALLSLAQ